MSQIFPLCIATETIGNDAQQLGSSIEDLKRICVRVSAHVVRQPALHLQLTYHITLPSQSLANQLNWPIWQAAQVGFFDYLWEDTCLECFIAGSILGNDGVACAASTESYIEMNASPDGRYALYQFEHYRHPAVLPPTPLYQADGHTLARIDWVDNVELPLYSEPPTVSKLVSYKRRIGLPLTQLPNQQYAIANTVIEHIHPCVILRFGKTTLYFAPSHASPPDFHNRQHWSKFKL
ncbi:MULTISPECIES: hypothetical protein [Psychrobacter]|uniref:hypothetical protein n=1 Tax=Psychrobacter TaxID=497 RepID=UPI000EC8D509|nr:MULTISPECIES: hypothetical protein [Psychrobacter]HCN16668.1 hypothetical protein [Psychrobacter sp.]